MAVEHKMESEVAKAVAAGTEAKSAAKNAQQVATWSKDEFKKLYAKNAELKH